MTWNFPCQRWGQNTKQDGDVYNISANPFSDAMTIAFALYVDSSFTQDSSNGQYICTIAGAGSTVGEENMAVTLVYDTSGGDQRIRARFRDNTGATERYNVDLGDEDGSSAIQADKWYQVVVSADDSSILYAVNGTTSPTVTVNTNNPGDLNLDVTTTIAERLWLNSFASGSSPASMPHIFGISAYMGPVWMHTAKLDLTDSAVLGRFYDSDGNFKSPGEDGSLWLGGYGGTTPTVYLPGGSPKLDNGSGVTWLGFDSNSVYSNPISMRKTVEL